jgi:hypothetical protein
MLIRLVYVSWCIVLVALFMHGLQLVMYSQGQEFALGTFFGASVSAILLYWAGKID